jgi:hypothetical protein
VVEHYHKHRQDEWLAGWKRTWGLRMAVEVRRTLMSKPSSFMNIMAASSHDSGGFATSSRLNGRDIARTGEISGPCPSNAEDPLEIFLSQYLAHISLSMIYAFPHFFFFFFSLHSYTVQRPVEVITKCEALLRTAKLEGRKMF